REHAGPVLAPIAVVVEFPKMHELVDRAAVGLEIADELAVVAAPLERRVSEFLIKLGRLRHLSDVERVGSHLVKRHYHILLPGKYYATAQPARAVSTARTRQASAGSRARQVRKLP